MSTRFELPILPGQAGKWLRVNPTETGYIWDVGAPPPSTGYWFLQIDGVAQPQEDTLNFLDFFTNTDNPGNSSSDVTLNLNALASSSDFVDYLIANTYFTNNLAIDTNFVDNLIANTYFTTNLAVDSNFISELIANTTFITNLVTEINTSSTITVITDGVTITGDGTTGNPLTAVNTGGVQSVTGLDTDNTDPANPIVKISVDGVTITGSGTPADPLMANVSGGGSGGTKIAIDTTQINITGDTSEHVLYSIPIAGGILGTNNGIKFSLIGNQQDVSPATFKLKYGGTTLISMVTAVCSTDIILAGEILANMATNVQNAEMTWIKNSYPVVQQTPNAGAVDSTVVQNLEITVALGNASGSFTAESIVVEAINGNGTGGNGEQLQTTVTQTNTFSQGDVIRMDSTGDYVLAQADTTVHSEAVGIVISATGTEFTYVSSAIKLSYANSWTQGDALFLDPTIAGGITNVKPTTVGQVIRAVGTCLSTTEIYFDIAALAEEITSSAVWNASFKNGVATRTVNSTGTQTIAHGLGAIPKKVKITAVYGAFELPNVHRNYQSFGSYDGTNTNCVFNLNDLSDVSSTYIVLLESSSTPQSFQATISVDATNITLTWSTTGGGVAAISTPTSVNILWEVEA